MVRLAVAPSPPVAHHNVGAGYSSSSSGTFSPNSDDGHVPSYNQNSHHHQQQHPHHHNHHQSPAASPHFHQHPPPSSGGAGATNTHSYHPAQPTSGAAAPPHHTAAAPLHQYHYHQPNFHPELHQHHQHQSNSGTVPPQQHIHAELTGGGGGGGHLIDGHQHHQQQQQPHHHHRQQLMMPYGGAEFYTTAGPPPDHGYYIAHEQMCAMHSEFGPVTVPMVSQGGSPPVPMPVQVPAGHVMQQIVDEHGTLRHVILSTTQQQGPTGGLATHMQGNFTNATPTHYFQPMAGAPGTGPPHFHSLPPGAHMQLPQQMSGHHHSATSPPTGANYHKDERSQRQHTKMLRKLEQKNRDPTRNKIETNGTMRHTTNQSQQQQLPHLNNFSNQHGQPAPPPHIQLHHQPQHATLLHNNQHHHQQHHQQQQQQQQHHHHHHHQPHGVPSHLLHAPLLSNGNSTTASGAASTASYEDGEDTSSVATDDEDIAALFDQLSSVQKPQISEITSRSALVKWAAPTAPSTPSSPTTDIAPATPPPPLNLNELRYEVLLSDRGKENKYKIIFKGQSLTCRIRDLRPGQEYSVCLQVYLQEMHGSPSEESVFATPGCEPDQPLPPKLIAKTKNSLQLRWNAPLDNGSHIIHYILETDEGKTPASDDDDGEPVFVEIIKMKGRQYSVPKLQPSTWYLFRLAAVNTFGRSVYSETAAFTTAGNAPAQMPAPTLLDKVTTSSQLHLFWNRRHEDEEYMLQISDPTSGHGFLTCYSGADTQYVCTKLKRATPFQFRLRAQNESGFSQWSEVATYATNPERPGRPARPQLKGKTHSTHFKCKWEPPLDRGGADITCYSLQIGAELHQHSTMETIFSGAETETICDRLSPGTTYHIRVNAEGPGGISAFSDHTAVTTEAVCPIAPAVPTCGQTPGPFAASVRWREPDYNGGAAVAEYELKLIGPIEDAMIYRGRDLHCVAKDLTPGTRYAVQVRAYNRVGAGPWSDELTFTAGAAAPFAPEQPEVSVQSAATTGACALVTWRAPQANGSPITEYQLARANWLEPIDEHSESQPPRDESFIICYQGLDCSAEVKQLLPHTRYAFRVSAKNSAGTSLFSTPASIHTPAAAPSAPTIDWHSATADEVTLRWRPAEPNGSPILYYHVDCPDRAVVRTDDSDPEWTLTDLQPETAYKIRVQAVNDIGAGPFSHSVRITTRALPPRPPKLECTGAGHNFLKLRWADGKNLEFTHFYLEMLAPRSREFQPIYDGKLMTFKVTKLQELQSYVFRIGAESDTAGAGDFSDEYTFQTIATLPSSVRAPRCTETDAHSVHLEWLHSRNGFADPVEYVLQMHGARETDFKMVYRGRDTHYRVTGLEPSNEYTFRVSPVRISDSGADHFGAYSPVTRQRTTSGAASTVFATSGGATTADGGVAATAANGHHNGDHSDTVDGCALSIGPLDLAAGPRSVLQRLSGKWALLMYNRKKMSDQDRAVVYSVVFLVATILIAWIIRFVMQQTLG